MPKLSTVSEKKLLQNLQLLQNTLPPTETTFMVYLIFSAVPHTLRSPWLWAMAYFYTTYFSLGRTV